MILLEHNKRLNEDKEIKLNLTKLLRWVS